MNVFTSIKPATANKIMMDKTNFGKNCIMERNPNIINNVTNEDNTEDICDLAPLL
tara:strand:+ start:497 stop:661 length:165 start_codon:yes stop_codon:yes gene_type:complete